MIKNFIKSIKRTFYKNLPSKFDLSRIIDYETELRKLLADNNIIKIESFDHKNKIVKFEIKYIKFFYHYSTEFAACEFYEYIDSDDLQEHIYTSLKPINIKYNVYIKKADNILNKSFTTIFYKIPDVVNWALADDEYSKSYIKGASEGFSQSVGLGKDIGANISKYLFPTDGVRLSYLNKLCNKSAKERMLDYDRFHSR